MNQLVELKMDGASANVCEQNITQAGVLRRYRWAAVFLLTFFIGLAVVLPSESMGLRALLLVPLMVSSVYFFQARERTCVVLAAVGKYEGADGYTAQKNSAFEMAAIRGAQEVWAKALMAVLLVGSAVFSIP